MLTGLKLFVKPLVNAVSNYIGCDGQNEGKECLHNILIMEELHDIIAVGAGTSSKIVHQEDHQVDRIENLKDIKQYITIKWQALPSIINT
mgnify:CR=1 FL=1